MEATIKINREQKLFLLQVLRDGVFDMAGFEAVFPLCQHERNPRYMTEDEILAEIERIRKSREQ